MSERERLVELLLESEPIKERDLDDDWGDNEISDIAEHLIKNGVIVPPCKVGDTVYSYCKEFGTVLAYFVEQITILYDTDNKRGLWVYEANCVETGDLIDCIDFYSEDIGKTVFLTKKAAEKALKGGAE